MESTLLIPGQGFKNMQEVAQWANDLVGKAAPHNSAITILRIIQFQVVAGENTFSALVLAEVEKKSSMSSMVLKMRKDMGLAGNEEN